MADRTNNEQLALEMLTKLGPEIQDFLDRAAASPLMSSGLEIELNYIDGELQMCATISAPELPRTVDWTVGVDAGQFYPVNGATLPAEAEIQHQPAPEPLPEPVDPPTTAGPPRPRGPRQRPLLPDERRGPRMRGGSGDPGL